MVQNNTKGDYLVFDATSGAADWEIVQGQPGGGSWFSFCKPMLENNVAKVHVQPPIISEILAPIQVRTRRP